MPAMHLQELKRKSPAELLNFAEELQVENASALRRQDMMFAILKQLAENPKSILFNFIQRFLGEIYAPIEDKPLDILKRIHS